MLKEILAQVALICFGDKENIFMAALLCLSPTLIAVAVTSLVMLRLCSGKLNDEYKRGKNDGEAITDNKYRQRLSQERECADKNLKENYDKAFEAGKREANNNIGDICKSCNSCKAGREAAEAELNPQIEKLQEEVERLKAGLSNSESPIEASVKTIAVENAEKSKDSYNTYAYGEAFEAKIIELLTKKLTAFVGKGGFRILHHVYLDNRDSRTEYDIILLMTSGIYFIECKSWAGLIIGTKEWNKWIQIKCSFSKNGKVPIFEDGLSAQYFSSPYNQVNEQKEIMHEFLCDYIDENDAEHQIRNWPRSFSKRIIVMNNLNGDTDSNVSLEKEGYFWYGTLDKLVERITKYHEDLPNGKKINGNNYYYQADKNGNLSSKMLRLYDILKERENKAPWRQNTTDLSESIPLQ